VFEGSNDATLSGNEVHANKLSGIDVNNSLRLRMTGNVVYGNEIGLHVHAAPGRSPPPATVSPPTGPTACGSPPAPARSRQQGT
jgi:parallel beta-helix repeat protein